MTRLNPTAPFAPAIAGLALVALLGALGLLGASTSRARGTDDPHPAGGAADVLRLRTDGLPTPLVIPGNPLERAVTSVEIRGELAGDGGGDGEGTLTLDESTFTFNEFGDAAVAKPKVPEPGRVTFKRVKQGEADEKRRLYEVVFADGSLRGRMFLVLSDGAAGPHRLLVRGTGGGDRGDKPGLIGEAAPPAQVLDLYGLPAVTEPLPAGPLRPPLTLLALSPAVPGRAGDGVNGGLRRVEIRGAPDGPAELDLDPNHLVFNAFGDVVGTTLIGYTPAKVTLKRLDVQDPAKSGRLLFDVVPDGGGKAPAARYQVVLSPTDAGPHRLLVRDGDRLRYVLPLDDPDRRYHLAMQSKLQEVPDEERGAVADLRRAVGYRFRVNVEAGHVVELLVAGGGDAGRVDPALARLKGLRRLEFNGPGLGPAGLPGLRDLPGLEQLRFTGGHVDDRGLASLKDLAQLQGLWFYGCRGITDQGLAHLAGLKGLKHLQFYREDTLPKPDPKEGVITDAGLEHLKGLTGLEYLNLMGQRVTDAGLERLKGLAALQELYLSGEGVTDAGLEQLRGLSHMRYLHLYRTGVTPTGRAALKAKVPALTIGG